ncbi:MAG: polyphenol oxidase family protein [Candidatus Neomarinimicrobiota bacterium]
MICPPATHSGHYDCDNQTGWFDFAPLLGGGSVQAVLSQRKGDYVGVSLAERRDILARQRGLAPERIAVPQQVHGGKVELAVAGMVHPDTDGLITNDPRIVLSLQVADCAPVFLYHPPTRFRGLVHAGWRGVTVGVLSTGADLLQARGVDLCQVEVVIGPTIEMACYEVGPEVVEAFSPTTWQPHSNGRFTLDLVAVVREQLIGAGIAAAKITSVDVCTYCDPRCHSYRREGEQAGRMVAFYYVKP